MGLIACASPKPADYAAERPVLDLREYFVGDIDAYGLFTDRSGKVVKRFTVKIKASWEGNKGVLEEDFIYSDGEKQRRVWYLTYQGDGRYTGTAEDVVGEASGEVAGNAFQWRYVLRLPVGERTYDVSFNDWMYLMDDKVMLNKAVMSKFGIRLGDVTLSFHKR
nr:MULTISPECIES: DUF3833 domain-containing protein [unclassified Pusillimonas]